MMKVKTIIPMLAVVLLGFYACQTSKNQEVDKYASTEFGGAGNCSINEYNYFGIAHNSHLDSIFRVLNQQVQTTGQKINLNNSAQSVYNEGMRCATMYQQQYPNLPTWLNNLFPNNLPYDQYLDMDTYEKYKGRAEQVINNSNRFTVEQKPLLNQLLKAVDTCTTKETFKAQIDDVENKVCQLFITR
ncbi:MAG: hypothetical protein OHK0045_08700 [Raineya sp.]